MPHPRKYAIVPQGTGWRAALAERKTQWATRNLDEIHGEIEDYVFMEALNGAKLSHIAREFGVPPADFESVYGDVWRLGNAQLQSTISLNTLEYGLKSKIPVAKIWLGKALGGLGEGKTVDVEGETDDNVTINLKLVRRKDDEPTE